jgi:sulfate adenylyltransferase subunit 2
VSESARPAMLYSVGKDSSVMLRLAQKAFYPGPIPFPLIHVDTGSKFKEMIEFRDRTYCELAVPLIAHTNQAGRSQPVYSGHNQMLCAVEDQRAAGRAYGTRD